MSTDSLRLTARGVLEIQREQLAQWRCVLRPEAYAALEAHLAAETAKCFEPAQAGTSADRRCALGQLKEELTPYDVPRGTRMDEFVGNYAIRSHTAVKKVQAEFPETEWRWLEATDARELALCTDEKVYAPNLHHVGLLDLSQAAVLEAPELTQVRRLHLGNCELRAPKLKSHKAEREEVTKANQALLAQAMEGKIATFTLSDPRSYALEHVLIAKGIRYRSTSQEGTDFTFYLEGHPKFEQRQIRQARAAQEDDEEEGQKV